jgi:hypothetical protein
MHRSLGNILPRSEKMATTFWLGGRDSNPDTQIQNLQSYRWTTSQQGWRERVKTILQLAPYDCVVQSAEKALAEVFGQFRELGHRFDRRRKLVHLDLAEAGFLHIKRQ